MSVNLYQNLVRASDQNILHSLGAIPVVTKGVIRTLETGERILKPSKHNAHEMTYLRSGSMKYSIAGKDYLLKAGDLFVIKPAVEHSFVITHGPVDLVVVYFAFSRSMTNERTSVKNDGVSSVPIDRFLEFVGSASEPPSNDEGFFVQGKTRPRLAKLLEEIVSEGSKDKYGKNLMLQALSLQLVVGLSRSIKASWEETLRVKNGKSRELVLIARDYIEEHYSEDISVSDIASYVFLSQGYFARAFREEMGMSPMAFLIDTRIKNSCEMLAKEDWKVSTIALKVGFASAQRFNAAFRQRRGMTPLQYRKENRQDKSLTF